MDEEVKEAVTEAAEEAQENAAAPEEEEVKGTITVSAEEPEEKTELFLGFTWKQIAIAAAALVAVLTSVVLLIRHLVKKR